MTSTSSPSHLPVGRRTSSFNSISTTTGARNPLNLKVNRILSVGFEDVGTRLALDTLGEFELATAQNEAGSDTRGINAALKRGGGLRKEVEGRMAQGSRAFLAAFSEVNDVCHCFSDALSRY